MDISAYTSNVQPYGSSGGTKLALGSGDATNNSVSTDKPVERKADSETAQKAKAVEQLVQKRIDLNKEQLEKMVEKMDEFVIYQ